MVKSRATPLSWRGLLAVAVGGLTWWWPAITVEAFVVVFSVYALLSAGFDIVRAFSGNRAGRATGYVLLAGASVLTALGALLWPGVTPMALTALVAAWALSTGIMEVALAFRHGRSAGERAMWLLSGTVSVFIGMALAVRPDAGLMTLASVFGVFSVLYGTFVLMLSARIRRAGHPAGQLA